MNAPPISEATFIVDEACNAMVDPNRGMLGTAEGVAEFTCAAENVPENSKNTRSVNNAVKNSFISEPEFPQPDSKLRPDTWNLRPALLHLVLAKVVIAQIFQPLPQFLAINRGHGISRLLRVLQHLVLNEDGTIHAQRQRQRVRRTRVDAHH